MAKKAKAKKRRVIVPNGCWVPRSWIVRWGAFWPTKPGGGPLKMRLVRA